MICPTIAPELGVTGTPVIDPSTNTLYVVATTKLGELIFHRLHALDVTSGAERPGSPVLIVASVPGTGDRSLSSTSNSVNFDAYFYKNRAGLLLLNGVVYTGWTSLCDSRTYAWLDHCLRCRVPASGGGLQRHTQRLSGFLLDGGATPAADAQREYLCDLRKWKIRRRCQWNRFRRQRHQALHPGTRCRRLLHAVQPALSRPGGYRPRFGLVPSSFRTSPAAWLTSTSWSAQARKAASTSSIAIAWATSIRPATARSFSRSRARSVRYSAVPPTLTAPCIFPLRKTD